MLVREVTECQAKEAAPRNDSDGSDDVPGSGGNKGIYSH